MAMQVKFWGTRGSIPTPGPEMARHGGHTACVELTLSDGSEVILDAGTGICDLGRARNHSGTPVQLLLTHLHLDHIQGLMFFEPLFNPNAEVCVRGPVAFGGPLLRRLARYISAPLAPIEIRELPARATFEDVSTGGWQYGPAWIEAAFLNHRGPTLGFRITDGDATVAYIPDHEPALAQRLGKSEPDWISGLGLARDADLLIHDCQYTGDEYARRIGWGHSAVEDAVTFARLSGARRLALFHHDPLHDDDAVDTLTAEAQALGDGTLAEIFSARQGQTLDVGG